MALPKPHCQEDNVHLAFHPNFCFRRIVNDRWLKLLTLHMLDIGVIGQGAVLNSM
jgi:hypothetical protein